MKKLLILLIFPIVCNAQISKLKLEFRNLSWITDVKSAEIISTLSYYFSIDSLVNQAGDTVFVSQKEYDLYYDSLSLWFLTRKLFIKDEDSTKKATSIGNFKNSSLNISNEEWIKIYESGTICSYKKSKNSTESENCIPSSYENLKLFYKKEKNKISSYNNGRIKIYEHLRKNNKDKIIIKFYLVFHETIKPYNSRGIKFGISQWIPYFYYYKKPVCKVYPATIKKLWEIKTGLQYKLIKELNISENRITNILNNIGEINDDVLIPIELIKKKEILVDKTYSIKVECDSCNIKIFDNRVEDNDIVDFKYKRYVKRFEINSTGNYYRIIVSDEDSFYLHAVSEGTIKTCTVEAFIDGKNYTFVMLKNEVIRIKLTKK